MKPKHKKIGKQSLSDKIADTLTVQPRPDIEDDHIFNTKPKTVSRADLGSSDSEDEVLISDFCKQSVKLLSSVSKKYEGKVVSRKELDEGGSDGDSIGDIDKTIDENSASESDESEDVNITNAQERLHSNPSDEDNISDEDSHNEDVEEKGEDDDEGDEDDDEGDGEDDDEKDDEDGYDISQMEQPMKEEFEHVKKQNVSEEAKKGICIRNQLLLWEGLLEMRIHLQRCVNSANQMPLTDVYDQLKESKEFVEESSVAITNVTDVIDKLLTLQNLLFNKYPETNNLAKSEKKNVKETEKNGKEKSDEEIPSDTDNEEIPSDTDAEDESPNNTETKMANGRSKKRKLEDYENDIASSHSKFKKFRDTTIQKCNEKTRVATAANIKNALTNTILQQISYILSDRNKLIRRTQLKRSDYDIIGYKKETDEKKKHTDDVNPVIEDRKSNDEYISEIFDDSDFYHQLLRELIECKSADISDPVQLSRQWIALQQMRSKMKRKVDTKATKGRRIKYVVHNQLVNYMTPENCIKWNDESKNELYSSLFGKIFEQNNIGINVNLENVDLKY